MKGLFLDETRELAEALRTADHTAASASGTVPKEGQSP
jgi:hypothetical protein